MVTWEFLNQDGSTYSSFGQRYGSEGEPVGSVFQVNTVPQYYESNASTIALSDGGFVVTWDIFHQEGLSAGTVGQRFEANGAEVGGIFHVNDPYYRYEYSSSTLALSDAHEFRCLEYFW